MKNANKNAKRNHALQTSTNGNQNAKSVQVIKKAQPSDEATKAKANEATKQASDEAQSIESLEAQAIKDEASASEATNEASASEATNENNEASEQNASDEKAQLESIETNYADKLAEVEKAISELGAIDYAKSEAKDIIAYGKKLDALQKSKAKLEKDKQSAILKAKKDNEAKAKQAKIDLENKSYQVCFELAKLENDSFNLNVTANAYNQRAIWSYNAFVALDGLFDVENHSELLQMLESESVKADELATMVKNQAQAIAQIVEMRQLENAHLLELSVMKKARRDAREASNELFRSKVGERPTIDENDEASENDEATSQVENVVLADDKREALKRSSEVVTV